MEDLKQILLSKLELIRDKMSYRDASPEVIQLMANHFDLKSKKRYFFSVEVIVEKQITFGEVEMTFFSVEGITFFMNEGEAPGFNFTNKEVSYFIEYS